MNTNPKPREAMGTKGFVLYLISSFSVAVLGSIYLTNPNDHFYKTSLSFVNPSSLNQSWVGHVDALQSDSRTWPELKFSWRLLLVTVIGFLGSAFGTVGGVGGGGIFVPMINLILGFDTKSAAALSKCMIMGASISSVWYNLRVPHPCKEAPILDYDLALLFQPMLMLGITMGVALSVIFPFWLITILIIILFMGTSSRSFVKGMEMWKQETIFNNEIENQQVGFCNSNGDVRVNADYEPLSPLEEKSGLEILRFNLCWKRIMVLLTVWVLFLLLQIIKNHTTLCGTMYWTLIILQFPMALAVFRYEAVKLYKESKKRRSDGNNESVCGATIQWNVPQIIFCAFCGILGGTVGGLLGSGGGFILGPLLLELGVIPQVASTTATFVMMFSSSLSVVEFYFLRRFPIPYAWYLIAVSMVAGFWGQFFVRKLVKILRRASIIIFILSAVIFASALTMGIVGTEKSIYMIHKHEYMGFLSFCHSNG